MSDETTVKRTLASKRRGRTDWARVDALTDEEIEAAVAADPDAAPNLDTEWFRGATLVIPGRKKAVSLRIDSDVLEWYKAQGGRYQSRMNAVLRAYRDAHVHNVSTDPNPPRNARTKDTVSRDQGTWTHRSTSVEKASGVDKSTARGPKSTAKGSARAKRKR
jgi:uncharacterized protein (DUF4415 family)